MLEGKHRTANDFSWSNAFISMCCFWTILLLYIWFEDIATSTKIKNERMRMLVNTCVIVIFVIWNKKHCDGCIDYTSSILRTSFIFMCVLVDWLNTTCRSVCFNRYIFFNLGIETSFSWMYGCTISNIFLFTRYFSVQCSSPHKNLHVRRFDRISCKNCCEVMFCILCQSKNVNVFWFFNITKQSDQVFDAVCADEYSLTVSNLDSSFELCNLTFVWLRFFCFFYIAISYSAPCFSFRFIFFDFNSEELSSDTSEDVGCSLRRKCDFVRYASRLLQDRSWLYADGISSQFCDECDDLILHCSFILSRHYNIQKTK